MISDFLVILVMLVVGATAIYMAFTTHTVHKDFMERDRKKIDEIVFEKAAIKNDAIYNVQIDKLINKLKYNINADKIFVCRFHNGGRYANGFTMKKFTMTNETHGMIEIRNLWRDKLIAHYADTIMQTLVIGDCSVVTPDVCSDKYFRKDMMEGNGYSSIFLYALKQYDGKEEGFLGVCYRNAKILNAVNKEEIADVVPHLIGLINMKCEL